jgi:hypothetical protein
MNAHRYRGDCVECLRLSAFASWRWDGPPVGRTNGSNHQHSEEARGRGRLQGMRSVRLARATGCPDERGRLARDHASTMTIGQSSPSEYNHSEAWRAPATLRQECGSPPHVQRQAHPGCADQQGSGARCTGIGRRFWVVSTYSAHEPRLPAARRPEGCRAKPRRGLVSQYLYAAYRFTEREFDLFLINAGSIPGWTGSKFSQPGVGQRGRRQL